MKFKHILWGSVFIGLAVSNSYAEDRALSYLKKSIDSAKAASKVAAEDQNAAFYKEMDKEMDEETSEDSQAPSAVQGSDFGNSAEVDGVELDQ